MSINAGLMSSASDLWETPQAFFDKLNEEFHFERDVCALPSNAKCAEYFTPEQDGLSQKWTGICWMNPPYGRQIGAWVKKAYEETRGGGGLLLFAFFLLGQIRRGGMNTPCGEK